MKKTKLIAGVLSVAMMSCMFGATVFADDPAWNTNGGKATVEGVSVPQPAIIEVSIPGELTFLTNPLRTNVDDGTEKGSYKQVVAFDYAISNMSNVPVVVETKTKVTPSSGVTLMSAATFDTNSHELTHSSSTKNAFLCLAVPTAVAVTSEKVTYTYGVADAPDADTGVVASAPTVKDDTTAKAVAMLPLTSSDQAVSFSLSAYSEANWTAAKCTTAFTIAGYLDPKSEYSGEDLKVTTVYTLNALTPSEAANSYKASTLFTGAHASVVEPK